jgi:hypothetical protein
MQNSYASNGVEEDDDDSDDDDAEDLDEEEEDDDDVNDEEEEEEDDDDDEVDSEEEVEISSKIPKTKESVDPLYALPTAQELIEMDESLDMFHSNLFKLEVYSLHFIDF